MLRRRWNAKILSLDVAWPYCRRGTQCQSINTSLQLGRRLPSAQARGIATSSLSPALLARARNVAQEYESLEKQLGTVIDVEIAKKAADLSETARAFYEWEAAQTVSRFTV